MSDVQPKIQVVNIISVSFSGSTWVNLLLGSHSEAFCVGEIKKVLQIGHAVCTVHGEDCPVWSRFEYPSEENPFVQISRITGKRLLVVNNSRKFLKYQNDPRIEPRFVHLMRDGRAVTASMLRKKMEPSMWRAARLWAHDVRRNQRLIRRQRTTDPHLMIYEKIKADPEGALRPLCEYLGIEYEPSMLEYWAADHHFLGGNRGTLFGMLRKTGDKAELPPNPCGESPTAVSNWDLDHYKRADAANFVDERWMKELDVKQLRVFALAAGRLNRKYGYAPSGASR